MKSETPIQINMTQHTKAPEIQPGSVLPWMPWVAQDQDGSWYMFVNRPRLNNRKNKFISGNVRGEDYVEFHSKYIPKYGGHWKDSVTLIKFD